MYIFGKELDNKAGTLVLSLISAAAMCLLIFIVYHFSVSNPNMILITALVLFTGIGGMVPGGVAAAFMVVYSMFFFSTDNSFLEYTDVNQQKMLIMLFGTIACYLIVGLLKRNRDLDRRNLVNLNNQLTEANRRLEEQAEIDAKIADLTGSVTSLLTNMPALTFSKDIATGKYLACNQLFAEYARKPTPEGVVGLTDHEIFDEKTADHFVEDDRIALSMDEPYIFFEDVPDAAGFPRHFQTTKQKFIDQKGRLCTLGMCVDVTELVRMKEETQEIQEAFEQSRYESLVFSHIASTLSADYTFVYYVDLETEEYVEYRADSKSAGLSEVVKGNDFFAASRANAKSLVYEEDQEDVIAGLTKENILNTLNEKDTFDMVYRLMVDGEPAYVTLKAKRRFDDDTHIVIGVRNIDDQMKDREEENRIKQERIAYARINALSGDYIVIYSVDPETCSYQEYGAQADYKELGLAKEGENFFAQARKDAKNTVYSEDQEKFLNLFTRINVLREINNNGIFALKYRLVFDNCPTYVRLKAALVEESGKQRLIVGVINIAEQVKQDEEYEYHLAVARTLANRDELTGVKNKHAYAELEREIDQQIEGWEPVEFGIAVFDVNELKQINDTMGHNEGNEYLKRACAIICNVFKHSPVFRIGGDEFAVIFRGQDYADAGKLIAEIDRINQENRERGDIVIACGMARYSGEQNVASVFDKADKQMYENKESLKASESSQKTG